jgi:hypothetical protein
VVHGAVAAAQAPGGQGLDEVVLEHLDVGQQLAQRRVGPGAGQVVDDDDVPAVLEQRPGEVQPHEAGAAGDEGAISHGRTSGR